MSKVHAPVLRPLFLFLLALGAFPHTLHAFPELIRHGYVNCNNCHASPSGGGAINDYGRTFSGEGLSTWWVKGEESYLNGAVPRKAIPKWLSLGGDVRTLQLWKEDQTTQTARSIFMQGDLEAAVKAGGFTFDLSLGRFQRAAEEPRLKSRRFFAMYNFTDEVSVRVGRFTPVYGINLPDHIIATRAPLGLDEGNETYNVEFNWLTDTWNLIVTGIQGPVENPTDSQESAVAAQIAYAFHDTYKIGVNGWSGRSNLQTRQMAGLYALFGFTPELYYLGEYDWKWTNTLANSTEMTGFYTYNRFGYEAFKGFHLLATVEYWQDNLNDNLSANDRYGAGGQWFPRPHWDIQAIWSKYRMKAAGDSFADYAWAMLHYYF